MNDPTSNFAAYLRRLLSLVVGLLALVVAINLLVDPFGVFGTRAIDGVNVVKVRAGQKSELFKVRSIERLPTRTVVLGNSRAEVGFDPESAAWPASARPVFNLAIPGTGLDSAARMLAVAARSQPVRSVVIGVDFPTFLDDPRAAAPSVPTVASREPTRLSAQEFGELVLSVSSLSSSLQTIAGQRDPDATQLTSRGFNPMREYRKLVSREGYGALFAQKNAEYARRHVDGPHSLGVGGRPSEDFRQLRELLKFCADRSIAVKLVIYPYHADFLEIVDAAGLWPQFEEWKRLLVVEASRPEYSRANVELWDFAGFSSHATETVPSVGDLRATMTWYWESGHFKRELGDVVIRDLFAASPVLGVRLDAAVIDAHLARERELKLAYETDDRLRRQRVADVVRRLSAERDDSMRHSVN